MRAYVDARRRGGFHRFVSHVSQADESGECTVRRLYSQVIDKHCHCGRIRIGKGPVEQWYPLCALQGVFPGLLPIDASCIWREQADLIGRSISHFHF